MISVGPFPKISFLKNIGEQSAGHREDEDLLAFLGQIIGCSRRKGGFSQPPLFPPNIMYRRSGNVIKYVSNGMSTTPL